MNLQCARLRGAGLPALALGLAILVGGCSGTQQTATTNDLPAGSSSAPVDERAPASATASGLRTAAVELWTARVNEDWPVVFAYQDDETRENYTADDYTDWASDNEPFVIRDWTFGEVLSEGPMGWVEVTSTTELRRYPSVPPRETHRWEKWHRVDGSWYPVPATESDLYPSTPVIRDKAEEQRLRARFGESWDARMLEDWGQLYDLSDPEDVASVGRDEFDRAHGKVVYMDHDVKWVEVVGDAGLVNVAYVFKLNDPNLTKLPPRSALVNERWVKRGDTWYRDLVGGGD